MNPVQDNPMRSRADVARAAVQLLTPLVPRMSEGHARIYAGGTGAVYSDAIARMEAFSRPLWAIVPMLAGKCPEVEPLWVLWRDGLANGVNPKHPEYWGDIGPMDQRMVEMAVMGAGMCLAPERFLGDLDEEARANLHRWLSQINDHDMPQNNWVFFRVLVNTGFLLNDLPCSRERLEADLALIEARYEGEGWYCDDPAQLDYYAAWGFHYDGLLYARAMRERDPERVKRFLVRARVFAPQFAAWFAADGEAIPYGRSLTYRFAQGSFYAALALAEEESDAIAWDVCKGILLRNLRKWCARPIFTGDGLLSIGYGYPNLNMAEEYNAPGSPYWALKAFLALALPEAHPFWQAKEAFYSAPRMLDEPSAGLLLVRDEGNRHVQAFAAGNHAPSHEHGEAKYEKFAYSTVFGFSVPRGEKTLAEGAFDSALVLTDDGRQWRTRFGCTWHAVGGDRVVSDWNPYDDVAVHTEIIPYGDWHVRVHTIITPRRLIAAEGGYAILRQTDTVEASVRVGLREAVARADWGISGIVAGQGYARAEVIKPAPNTNLLHTRTLLPTLHATIEPGETKLVCAVLGAVLNMDKKWASPPEEVSGSADMG